MDLDFLTRAQVPGGGQPPGHGRGAAALPHQRVHPGHRAEQEPDRGGKRGRLLQI
jgi:hypothetical protein